VAPVAPVGPLGPVAPVGQQQLFLFQFSKYDNYFFLSFFIIYRHYCPIYNIKRTG